MMQVPRDLLDEIRARSDIVDVIGGHLQLIRAGSRFKALCPFHREKTPSFHVNPQMQAYHCFGCGVGGDVFRFVMEHEGVDFMTAVRLLAHRAGIPMRLDESEGESEARGEKDALYRVHEDLTAFYQERLCTDPAAEPARAYLASRDLAGEPMGSYRFGFAPAAPGALKAWAQGGKVSDDLLVKAGILAQGEEGRLYDRFRGRLMIPISDELGRVIGFTARVLRAEDSPAKYINSPETPLFRKSRVLFGLDRARKAIADGRCAVLCEGQLDTIRCQVAGITHAVAAQGTAVTEEHARILARYADEVILLMDPDAAGRKASLRSAQLLIAAGLGVRIASLPENEDPDSLIRRAGPDAVRAVLDAAEGAMRFLVRELERQGELRSEAGMLRASRAAIELAAQASGAVQQEQLLRDAAAGLGIGEDALRRDFRRRARRMSGPPPEDEAPPAVQDAPEEVALIELVLSSDRARDEVRHYVPPDRLSSPRCRAALSALLRGGIEGLRAEAGASGDDGLARLVGSLMVSSRFERVSSDELPPEEIARKLIARIWRRRLEEQRAMVQARLREAPSGRRPPLQTQSAELAMRIAALKRGWTMARAVIEAELDVGDGEE